MRWCLPSENQDAALLPSLCKRHAPCILIQMRRIRDTRRMVYNPHSVPTAARLTHLNKPHPRRRRL